MPIQWANALVNCFGDLPQRVWTRVPGAENYCQRVWPLGGNSRIREPLYRYNCGHWASRAALLAGKSAWGPLVTFWYDQPTHWGNDVLSIVQYLFRVKKPVLPYLIPMVFVVGITTAAMTNHSAARH